MLRFSSRSYSSAAQAPIQATLVSSQVAQAAILASLHVAILASLHAILACAYSHLAARCYSRLGADCFRLLFSPRSTLLFSPRRRPLSPRCTSLHVAILAILAILALPLRLISRYTDCYSRLGCPLLFSPRHRPLFRLLFSPLLQVAILASPHWQAAIQAANLTSLHVAILASPQAVIQAAILASLYDAVIASLLRCYSRITAGRFWLLFSYSRLAASRGCPLLFSPRYSGCYSSLHVAMLASLHVAIRISLLFSPRCRPLFRLLFSPRCTLLFSPCRRPLLVAILVFSPHRKPLFRLLFSPCYTFPFSPHRWPLLGLLFSLLASPQAATHAHG